MNFKKDKFNVGKSEFIKITLSEREATADLALQYRKKYLNSVGTIWGKVTDLNNNPIKDAIIRLGNGQFSLLIKVTTNINGDYVIDDIPNSDEYSITIFSLGKVVQEIKPFNFIKNESNLINFILKEDVNYSLGAISGEVYSNETEIPIFGAVVSLFSNINDKYTLKSITYTNDNGAYMFGQLPLGEYSIVISALGYVSSHEIALINSKDIRNIKSLLNISSKFSNGIISGMVVDNLDNPIPNASVILYNMKNNLASPVAFTITNEEGIYIFNNVPIGDYVVKSNQSEIIDLTIPSTTPTLPTVSNNKFLTTNPLTNTMFNFLNSSNLLATSLGFDTTNKKLLVKSLGNIVNNNLGNLAYFTARLYDNNGNEIIGATVNGTSNADSFALSLNGIHFEYGYYLTIVHMDSSTKLTLLGSVINAPLDLSKGFNNIDLSTVYFYITPLGIQYEINKVASSSIAITVPTTSTLVEGLLQNGAQVLSTGAVTNIGGTTDGSVIVNYVAQQAGRHALSVIVEDSKNPLTIDVNGINTGVIYNVGGISASAITVNTIVVSVTIPLNSGNNVIKFHGDGSSPGPDLFTTKVNTIPKLLPKGSYNVADGIFTGSTRLNTVGDMATYIGGPMNGTSSINVNTDLTAQYNLAIKYNNGLNPFEIEVNGVNTGKVYTPNSNQGTFTLPEPINLNVGSNIIKFKGNGINSAPDFGIFSISVNVNKPSTLPIVPTIPTYSYNVSKGLLQGGAILDVTNNLATYLGGPTDGSSTVGVNVVTTTVYNLTVSYRNSNRPLKIDINGINTGTIYNITGSSTGVFTISLNLSAGASYIKFYGDGVKYAPDLGGFTLSTLAVVTSTTPITMPVINTMTINATDKGVGINKINFSGVWNGSAGEAWTQSINSTFIINFKGVGISLIGIKDPRHGVYQISIDNGAVVEVDANSTTRTQSQTIYDSGVLTDGNHTLQFNVKTTDAQINYAVVNLGQVLLTTTPLQTTTIYSYNAINGNLENGAKADSNTNFAGYIGGPTDGSTTLEVNVDSEGLYKLSIEYIGADFNRPLAIDINGTGTGEIYNTPKTPGWSLLNALIFNVVVNLNSNKNIIKFHGDGVNYGPSLGRITLTKVQDIPQNTPTLPQYYYNAVTNGSLSGGAKIENIGGVNIVGWIGGPTDGAVTLGVNVSNSQSYNLLIKYVSQETRSFKIDINTISKNQLYTIVPTKTWLISDASIATIPLNLLKGINIIKIHGDGTNYAPSILDITITNPKSSSIPTINIYRNTSLSPHDAIEKKKFNIAFHTLEPLGIEILYATEVSFFIQGHNISGTADVNLHDVDNMRYISTIKINETKVISIPRKGELFLNIANVKNTLGDIPFSFKVNISIDNDINYIITPTFDVRKNKIFESTIKDIDTFSSAIKNNQENGVLMISDNARLYFPKGKFVSPTINPISVAQLHEQTISEHDKLSGLEINALSQLDKPRRNFVLVSARNEHGGYMSAGNTMLDTHPESSGAYLSAGWGMFHEYGHLYDQGWIYLEIWNNMYSKNMAEKTIGFTWLWGNDRASYEKNNIEIFYKDYLIDGKFIPRGFGFGTGLYFFISLQEFFSDNFVGTMTGYYRNNNIPYGQENYIVYAIAKNYGVNAIPYMQMYGYLDYNNDVINFVVDNSTSSMMYIPKNSIFEKYKNISLPPTIKSIYSGINQELLGISNSNSQIKLNVNGKEYTANTDINGRFKFIVSEAIDENSNLIITSKESEKLISPSRTIFVKTKLSDNLFSFYGLGDYLIVNIGFNVTNKILVARSTGSGAHSYFGNDIYFSLTVYDSNGVQKASSSVTGNENANSFATTLNGLKFEYGYYIKITHQEPGRAHLYGGLLNAPSSHIAPKLNGVDLTKSKFSIEKTGIEYKL